MSTLARHASVRRPRRRCRAAPRRGLHLRRRRCPSTTFTISPSGARSSADGWTVTHDPYTLAIGNQNVFVDLGAERMIAATRGSERIAVEVKSFLGRSSVADLEQALGQYLLYRVLLARQEPGRTLFLAAPLSA